jgi:hypothetical protein
VSLTLVLCLFTFAVGAVTVRRAGKSRRSSPAHPIELAIAVLALVAIAVLRPAQHTVVYAATCAVALIALGALAANIRRPPMSTVPAGTREFEREKDEQAVNIWKGYLKFSRAVVDYEFRLLLVAAYLLFVAPMALAARADRKRAQNSETTNWVPRPAARTSMESARRSF